MKKIFIIFMLIFVFFTTNNSYANTKNVIIGNYEFISIEDKEESFENAKTKCSMLGFGVRIPSITEMQKVLKNDSIKNNFKTLREKLGLSNSGLYVGETYYTDRSLYWLSSKSYRLELKKDGGKLYTYNSYTANKKFKVLCIKDHIQCRNEYELISNGVYSGGTMPKCCNGLNTVKYDNYNQVCVNKNDGKCGKYETYTNSLKDCKINLDILNLNLANKVTVRGEEDVKALSFEIKGDKAIDTELLEIKFDILSDKGIKVDNKKITAIKLYNGNNLLSTISGSRLNNGKGIFFINEKITKNFTEIFSIKLDIVDSIDVVTNSNYYLKLTEIKAVDDNHNLIKINNLPIKGPSIKVNNSGKLFISKDLSNYDNKNEKNILAGNDAFIFSFDTKSENEEVLIGEIKFNFNHNIYNSIKKADLYLDDSLVSESISNNISSNSIKFENLRNFVIPEETSEVRLKIYTNVSFNHDYYSLKIDSVTTGKLEGITSGKTVNNVFLSGNISNEFHILSKTKICTKEYKPVCGIYNGNKITYSNKCEMEKAKAKYLFKGKCEDKFNTGGLVELFNYKGGEIELLNNKYKVKKGDILRVKTLFDTTKIKSNISINFDTVIYDRNGKKLDSCVKKSTSISYYKTQIKTYCELNYFKIHSPNGKKYKIVTQINVEQNGKNSSNKISSSFVIGKKEDPQISKNCTSWYDGCNTCFVNNGKIGACTKRYCIRHDTPKCLKYIDEKDENVRYIMYVYKRILGREATITEINYYKNKKQYGGKKYFENQIQDGVIKNILLDLLKGKLFIDKNAKGYYKENFIGNLYKIGLGRKIDSEEYKRLEKEWSEFFEYKHYIPKDKDRAINEMFDYFFESKEFEKFMKYNNYHFTNYSNSFHGKVGEYGNLNIKLLDVFPLTIKRECGYDLTAISDRKGDKICLKIGDGKCGKYENKSNSIDCKIGCKNYNVPSGAKKIHNSKNCVIGYDKIGKINTKDYECINYPIYSYNFETKKQINHYLPNGFYPEFCKYTGVRDCGKETVYINSYETCCSGLTKVKVKGTDNFSKCIKIDNYCSENEKDTFSLDCKEKDRNVIDLSDKLKIKIDSIIKKFILKMDEYNFSNDKKINRLKLIIAKINILKLTHKKYENLFNYLNKKLEEEIAFLLIGM